MFNDEISEAMVVKIAQKLNRSYDLRICPVTRYSIKSIAKAIN